MTAPMTAAQLTIGAHVLVKDTDGRRDFRGMTGEVCRINGGYAFVKLTAWGTTHVIHSSDLTVVRQPQRAPAERGAGEGL